MEFVNGVKEKRVLDIREVLEGEYEGKEIRMNGAVHTIRHMGEVAFVILRKSRGLVQCVYEAGITDFDIRELKEESAVEVMGVVKAEERAPQGFEIRFRQVRSRMVHGIPPWRYTDVMIVVRETGKWNDSRKCQKQWKQKYRLN